MLRWVSGNGLSFNTNARFSSFQIEDLSITTSSVGGGTIGFSATGGGIAQPVSTSVIKDVSIRGDDCYACSDYWGTGLQINGWSNVNLYSPVISGAAPASGGYSTAGYGAVFTAPTGSPSVQYNVTGGQFLYEVIGILYSGYAQGLTINQSNFVGNSYGINTPPGAHVTQMSVTNSQFNSSVAGIADSSGILYDQISNSSFIEPAGSTSVYLQANDGFNITGNTFTATNGTQSNTNGIIINNNVGGVGTIVGNLFSSLSTGILLAPASRNVNVQANNYIGTGLNVNNAGANNSVGVATQ